MKQEIHDDIQTLKRTKRDFSMAIAHLIDIEAQMDEKIKSLEWKFKNGGCND